MPRKETLGEPRILRGKGPLTRDVASQGLALTVLILEGGGDRVQPQEEEGLWGHRTLLGECSAV